MTPSSLWIKAIGKLSDQQVKAGIAECMRQCMVEGNSYAPDLADFLSYISRTRESGLGVTIEDAMQEFHRYNRDKGLYTGGAEKFPWRHPVFYWIVCDARRAMYQRCLNEAEVKKYAAKKLDEWSRKVADGESIPEPIKGIDVKPDLKSETVETTKHQGGYKRRYMPNAAMLGSVTPAQWLYAEYKRKKAAEIATPRAGADF